MKEVTLVLMKSIQDDKICIVPNGDGKVAICSSVLNSLASSSKPSVKLAPPKSVPANISEEHSTDSELQRTMTSSSKTLCDKIQTNPSSQHMNDVSFIPIIFTNAQGETQEISASHLPPEVLSEASLSGFKCQEAQQISTSSCSVSSVVKQNHKSVKKKSYTHKLNSKGKPVSCDSIALEKLNSEQRNLAAEVGASVDRCKIRISAPKSSTQLNTLSSVGSSHKNGQEDIHDHEPVTLSVNSEHCYGKPAAMNTTSSRKIDSGDVMLMSFNTPIVLEESLESAKQEKSCSLPSKSWGSLALSPKTTTVENTTNTVEKVACYKCKFCLFLSLSEEAVTNHAKLEHPSDLPVENRDGLHCPGCSNIFYSKKSFEVHLTEDHNTADEELKQILDSFRDILIKIPSISKKQPLKNNSASHTALKSDRLSHSAPERLGVDGKNKSGRGKAEQHTSELLPADETGKIRVRKLSSFKVGSSNGRESRRSISLTKCATLVNENCTSLEESDSAEILHASPFGVVAANDVPSDEISDICEIPVEIYEVQSSDFLDVQLTTSESKDSEFMEAQLSCISKIEETLEEETLHGEGQIMDCSPTSPSALSLESSEHSLVETSFSEGIPTYFVHEMSIEEENDTENFDTTNVDLGNTVPEEFSNISPRKQTARQSKKKHQRVSKNQKLMLKSPRIPKIKEESDSVPGYCCRVPGCSVRLVSHDNLQYHLRCHVLAVEEPSSKSARVRRKAGSSTIRTSNIFACPECSKESKSWALLKNHLWHNHSIDMELYCCDKCNYKTARRSDMINLHQRIHGTDKPFLCDICGKGFKTVKALRNHKVFHVKKSKAPTGNTDRCSVCNRSFANRRMLRNHIEVVHNKVRPYMCSECGHTAASRSSLTIHLRQHTGDRPYKCDKCTYQTADHNSLRRHKKRHTGEKQYKCPYCSYSSIQSTTFKSHLKNKHPGQVSGILFSCSKCSFHTVNHEIYLAHVAEHGTESSIKIRLDKSHIKPYVTSNSEATVLPANPQDQYPIYVSIGSDASDDANTSPDIEAIVENISKAITPGSQIHVLYNSVVEEFSQQSNMAKAGSSYEKPVSYFQVKNCAAVEPNESSQEALMSQEEQMTGDLSGVSQN